ncbi:conserved hypothetical protein [Ricinus communis]|uniref:Uncharacterized protein n=1 Tax=Ricinus communis TaxID=3988 RepID=B9RYL2_RICCO|nr:conserved hypothetical protein [Ricinus communis]
MTNGGSWKRAYSLGASLSATPTTPPPDILIKDFIIPPSTIISMPRGGRIASLMAPNDLDFLLAYSLTRTIHVSTLLGDHRAFLLLVTHLHLCLFVDSPTVGGPDVSDRRGISDARPGLACRLPRMPKPLCTDPEAYHQFIMVLSLCEKFSSILGFYPKLILTPLEVPLLHEISSFFDMGVFVIRDHLRGPNLKLSSFIGILSQFAPNSRTWLRVLQFFLKARFLFDREDGLEDLKLILVLAQMCALSKITPLMLADTLTELDRVKRDKSTQFSGNLVVLQRVPSIPIEFGFGPMFARLVDKIAFTWPRHLIHWNVDFKDDFIDEEYHQWVTSQCL